MTKKYAGFWVRAVARIADLAVVEVLSAIVGLFASAVEAALPFDGAHIFFNIGFSDIAVYIASALYFALLTQFNNGQTLGKKLFRIKVISSDGKKLTFFRTLYRETVGRYLTGLLCTGYIVAGALVTKQGFHDMLADTYVVYDFDDVPEAEAFGCNDVPERICLPTADGTAEV